jgi:hypothetical protein
MFKKVLLRAFLALIVLILSVFILFLIANWGDNALRPEVQAELSWQPPKVMDEDNAYLLLLGLNAREGIDPLILGKRKLVAEIQRYEEDRHSSNYDPNSGNDPDEKAFIKPKMEVCDYSETINCVAFYLSRSVEQEQEILSSQRILLRNFERLRASGRYQEITPPHIAASIPSFASLMHATELERMRAIRMIASGQQSKGLDSLMQLSTFSQVWLERSDTLISHMIAMANLQRDLRILDEVIDKFPELIVEQEKIGQWANRFSIERMSILRAFKHERQVSLQLMQNLFVSDVEAQQDWTQRQLTKLINRPNAALNLTYDWYTLWTRLLQEHERPYSQGMAELGAKQKALLGFGFTNIYLQDPMIKILLEISTPGFETYIEKHYDMFLYADLLTLKLDILKRNIPLAEIPQFLQKHALRFPKASEGRAISWDAKRRQLFVETKHESNQLYQKSKIVRLNVLLNSESGVN